MQLNSETEEKDFEIIYKGNRILIRNEGQMGERLYINSILQDQNNRPNDGRLLGYIYDLNNNAEKIEAVLAGSDELECQVYADGSLIYSTGRLEPILEKPKNRTENRRKNKSNLVILFSIILMVVITFLVMLPYLTENQADEDRDKDQVPAAASTEMIEVDFSWGYGNGTWSYHLTIPKSACDYYKTIDRNHITNYSYYVKDTTDDEYLAGLANTFQESARQENYSDLDTVNNIISFVQNLEYVSDKVGTGYDEYPKFPLETLADQGGDCEDSAILLASLLRELGYGTVLIQLPDHMAVGVQGNDSVPGVYYEVNGIRYYYVETTATGWKIGDIPDQFEGKSAKILTFE